MRTSDSIVTLDGVKKDKRMLLEVLGLERSGPHCKCPFHDDKHGSMDVREDQHGVWRFRCFTCDVRGTVVDAFMRLHGVSFHQALQDLHVRSKNGSRHGSPRLKPSPPHDETPEPEVPVPDTDRLCSYVAEAEDRLLRTERYLTYLHQRRGITREVASSLNVGIDRIENDRGGNIVRCQWVMPIIGADMVVRGVKLHWENPPPQCPKCLWGTFGTRPEGSPLHRYITLWPPPENAPMEKDLFLCPGELKALALLSIGFESTAITAGESYQWTPGLIERLAGRRVCLLYDEDEPKLRADGSSFIPGIEFWHRTEAALGPVVASFAAISGKAVLHGR